jgi:putative NIF3 family GTP cyclohydrolase 1 type 2/GNAT superfamily N-acetyltransferase
MALVAQDIHEHFRSVGTWVNWQGGTCDGFKYGDPQTVVRGIAVAWQSTQAALEEAHAQGCNLFITHEPTFYSHMDDDAIALATRPAQRKQAFLDETGMVVYRCHDVWDVFPEIGIVDAWGEFLELGQPVVRSGYYRVYEVPRTTAWELARRVGQRVAQFGEQSVQFTGKRWRIVERLAIGTGAITQVQQMVGLGADVVLATDDGMSYWRDGSWMADADVPMIVVNHMTSEIPGLQKLASYLQEQFPDVPVRFVGPICSFEILAKEIFRDPLIQMRRDTLDDLPPLVIPEGYTLRPMQADEAWAYLAVMNRSNYSNEIGEDWFKTTYSNDPEYDPSFLQIIWKGDQPVAAAGAWHREIDGERWGMIHWVGALDTERGRGLGKAVVLAALWRLKERGFDKAMLGTQGWRLPAIQTYLRLGFRPWPRENSTQEMWDRVLADLEAWRAENKLP